MSYTKEFDQYVVDRYRSAEAVRTVTIRMGHLEKSMDSQAPSITVTQHRIREIEQCSDWGQSYTKAPWFILHHANNANALIGSTIRNWSTPMCTHGLRNLHNEAINSIKNVRERIDPLLYGIEKELDPRKAARVAYDAFESESLRAIDILFATSNTFEVPKSKLRAHQISSVQKILAEFQRDLQAWTDELKQCISPD